MQVAAVESIVQQAHSELERWQAALGTINVLELAKGAAPSIDVELSCRTCSTSMQQARHAGLSLSTASAQDSLPLEPASALVVISLWESMEVAKEAYNCSALLRIHSAVLLSFLTEMQTSRLHGIASAAPITVYAHVCAGDAVAAGQRHREALTAQLDPHTGESARLVAMVQEAEIALSGIQARPYALLPL